MTISPTEAADVAKRYGLGLQDAAGLLSLAKDVDDANAIAARFAAPATDAAAIELTRQLFGHTPKAEPPEPADEGKPASPDIAARRFASNLFNKSD